MQRRLAIGAVVGVAGAAVALALWAGGVLERWEFTTWQWRVRLFAAPGSQTPKVHVILLDQASLDWGREQNGWPWPWPREVYAPILDFCRRGGARSVAFDVLFTEPSAMGVADDVALGAGIRRGPPFVGALFLGKTSGAITTWPAAVPRPAPVVDLGPWLRRADPSEVVAERASFPVSQVATQALWLGNVHDDPDADGVYRRAALYRIFDGNAVPSLGVAACLAATNQLAHGGVRAAGRVLRIAGRDVPVDAAGRAILRFRGPTQTHRTFNAADVIRSELQLRESATPLVDPSVFRDCYVFLGFSAPGLMDLRPTPLSRVYPGVEIHATVLDNLLTGDFLRDAPPAGVALATLVLAALAGLCVVGARKARQTVLAFAVFLPAPALAGLWAYGAGLWWPIVPAQGAVLLALVGGVVWNYATEGRQKQFIKSAFRQYLSAEVIERMLEDPAQLKLGGEKRELTIFFSDLEKFSSFSERLDPPTLTALLNDYLTDMTAIIMAEGGTLDKYVGDAIVAFWNAPLSQPDHAARACRAALRCQRRLAERRAEFEARTGAVVRMRIGLHTGAVVVGNLGSRDRFSYTVLGDAANLASRLEGANKVFGTYLLVSDATWQAARGGLLGRAVGRLRVVGRAAPVTVHEVAGLANEPVPSSWKAFDEALRFFRAGCFAEAGAGFEPLAASDPVARRYADMCRAMAAAPPPDWDGVLNLTEK